MKTESCKTKKQNENNKTDKHLPPHTTKPCGLRAGGRHGVLGRLWPGRSAGTAYPGAEAGPPEVPEVPQSGHPVTTARGRGPHAAVSKGQWAARRRAAGREARRARGSEGTAEGPGPRQTHGRSGTLPVPGKHPHATGASFNYIIFFWNFTYKQRLLRLGHFPGATRWCGAPATGTLLLQGRARRPPSPRLRAQERGASKRRDVGWVRPEATGAWEGRGAGSTHPAAGTPGSRGHPALLSPGGPLGCRPSGCHAPCPPVGGTSELPSGCRPPGALGESAPGSPRALRDVGLRPCQPPSFRGARSGRQGHAHPRAGKVPPDRRILRPRRPHGSRLWSGLEVLFYLVSFSRETMEKEIWGEDALTTKQRVSGPKQRRRARVASAPRGGRTAEPGGPGLPACQWPLGPSSRVVARRQAPQPGPGWVRTAFPRADTAPMRVQAGARVPTSWPRHRRSLP